MADYCTPTVVDPMIPLAAMLPIERLFLSQVFDEELTEGVHEGERPQGAPPPEPLHWPFASPELQLRVLGPVVEPVSGTCRSSAPISRRAAPKERSPSVTTSSARPCRFISFLRNLRAAALSRVLLTKDSSTSPSWSTARQR